MFDVRQTSTPLKLTNLGVWTLDTYQPDIQTVSAPTGYTIFREDPDSTSANTVQVTSSGIILPTGNNNNTYLVNITEVTNDDGTTQPVINVVSNGTNQGQTLSTNSLQMSFFPIPDAVYNMEVRYVKELADMSAGTTVSQIPVPYHNVLADGAEWLGSKFLNDGNEDALKQKYEYGLEKMIERENAFGDYLPVLGSSDTQETSRFLPFPSTFQQPR